MRKYEQKYQNNLKDGRLADAEKYLSAKSTIESLINSLSMSVEAKDKEILPLALFLHQILSVIDDKDSVCVSTVVVLYEKHLYDIHCRLCDIEEIHTGKYWWSKVQWLHEAGKIVLTIAAVTAILKGIGV